MSLFENWCVLDDSLSEPSEDKHYWLFSEKDDGRSAILPELTEILRSYYVKLETITEDIEDPDCDDASEVMREELPDNFNLKSGDLGEIIATELVEEKTDMHVPVRRMIYITGKNQSLVGDDFIAIKEDENSLGLKFLKGEAKNWEKN